MIALSSLLPAHLVEPLRQGDPAPEPPRSRRTEAALLLSDIAGLTALTERLQARGREGAEEVARLMSAAFRPCIAAIERGGGSVVSFGGDALFAMFPGAGAARRARNRGRRHPGVR